MNLTETIERKNDRSHDVFDAMRKSRINWRDAMVVAYGVSTYETYLWKRDRPAWDKVFGDRPPSDNLWGDVGTHEAYLLKNDPAQWEEVFGEKDWEEYD